MTIDDILENEKSIWTRSTPADLFYVRDAENAKIMMGTAKLKQLCEDFEKQLVMRARGVNAEKPKYEPPPRKNRARLCKHKSELENVLLYLKIWASARNQIWILKFIFSKVYSYSNRIGNLKTSEF